MSSAPSSGNPNASTPKSLSKSAREQFWNFSAVRSSGPFHVKRLPRSYALRGNASPDALRLACPAPQVPGRDGRGRRVDVGRWTAASGKLVGVLSQRDLAGILGTALNEPEALEKLVDASTLARERRLSRIEAGIWD